MNAGEGPVNAGEKTVLELEPEVSEEVRVEEVSDIVEEIGAAAAATVAVAVDTDGKTTGGALIGVDTVAG